MLRGGGKRRRTHPHDGQMRDAEADLARGEGRRDGDLEVLVGRLRGVVVVVLGVVRARVDEVAEHLADVGRRALRRALRAAARPEPDRDPDLRRPGQRVLCAYNQRGSARTRRTGEKTGGEGKDAYGSVHLDGDVASGLDLGEVRGGADLDALGERGRGEGDESESELHGAG